MFFTEFLVRDTLEVKVKTELDHKYFPTSTVLCDGYTVSLVFQKLGWICVDPSLGL